MQFGIASCSIVPPFPTTMGGYGNRDDQFDGVHDPLEFTALILEENGRRALIGSADLVNFANDGRTEILLDRLAQRLGTSRDQIMLNATHTHGGPKLPGNGYYSLRYGNPELAEKYADWLADRVVETADAAMGNMQAGTLHHVRGRTCLPMNRRRLVDGQIMNAPNPEGPVDDKLDLLTIKDDRGRLAAVMMRLSCHPVASGSQHQLTGDFVGGWKAAFKETLPHVTPIFLQGAAGDIRPRHAQHGDQWRKVPLSQMLPIGRELLAEMLETLICGQSKPLGSLILQGEMQNIDIPCERRYMDEASIKPLLESSDALEKEFAQQSQALFRRGEEMPTSMSILTQTLWLDDQIALVGLNVEPLIALGSAIEHAFAPKQALVLGYTNGCVCYAPDSVELARGGYEAVSYLMEPLSGPWSQGFEQTIIPHLTTSPAMMAKAD